MKRLFGLGMIGFSLLASAGPQRCQNMDAGKCNALREGAVKQGCIKANLLFLMRLTNTVPMCVGSSQVGTCTCGCFAPEARLSVWQEGRMIFLEAEALNLTDGTTKLVSLAAASTLQSPTFKTQTIEQKTSGNEQVALVRLTFGKGLVLRLTEKHPVLLSSGEMKSAREITLGDHLVSSNGQERILEGVGRESFEGNVYNFKTGGNSLPEHVVVAEGLLVGDLSWQNALEEEREGLSLRQGDL